MTRRRIDGRINPENSPVIQSNRMAREGLPQHLGTIVKIVSSQKDLSRRGRSALAFYGAEMELVDGLGEVPET
jgi:hypothetical protein